MPPLSSYSSFVLLRTRFHWSNNYGMSNMSTPRPPRPSHNSSGRVRASINYDNDGGGHGPCSIGNAGVQALTAAALSM